ncbi:MAG: FGGY family carbohydrate kinase [Candidatus Enteromonas sp.]|nr:FGGY family carbohydrate kinase [Candidatus Enteromonas sp.]
MARTVLAIDLGASSGRAILGQQVGEETTLQEVYRFPNGYIEVDGHLYWDVDSLFAHILAGIKKALEVCPSIESMSIDTWGVDYVLLQGDKPVLPVYCYRDSRTQEAIEAVHRLIPFEKLYAITGISFQTFNTIYQLYADKMAGRLEGVTDCLMLPEYFMYRLTGKKVKEHTNAGTTGLIDALTLRPSETIFSTLGLNPSLFANIQKQGTLVGDFTPEIQGIVHGNIPVKLCPTHDTAAAIDGADIPMDSPYISSGTWSLLGVKRKEPLISKEGLEANYSNEFGKDYFRVQKNIMGTWILQCLSKELGLSFVEMIDLSKQSDFIGTFDVNESRFLAPKSMKKVVLEALGEQGYSDISVSDLLRSVHASLAKSYADAIHELEKMTGSHYSSLLILGGGAKNAFLNSLVEEATHLTVIPRPIEATSMGNILAQLREPTK